MLRYITRVDRSQLAIDWKTGPIFLTLRFLDVHLQTENAKIAGWSSW